MFSSSNQHRVGGGGGVLIYVRRQHRSLSHSLWGASKNQSTPSGPGPAQGSDSSHIEQSLLHNIVNPKAI